MSCSYKFVSMSADHALLIYPGFAEDPFPALSESWLVNLEGKTVSYRT